MANLSDILTARSSQGPSDNFKNLIINGAMQVAQRSTSVASITTSDYRTVDRFKFEPSNMGTWTMSQENDAPTGSGFRKSTKILCTTADASPAAGDYVQLYQRLEGQNLQQIKKGTAAAEQLTVSFWVKSNVTGTYIVDLYDNDNARSVSKSYTINTSATWEYKTVTFPADTTGALDNDNANSLSLEFGLGYGSNFTSGTLQTTWGSYTAANYGVGQTNLAAATNNYWQITGVQLEVGDVATPFEFKPFDVELAQCQRYYYLLAEGTNIAFSNAYYYTASNIFGYVHFPTTMRGSITLSITTGTNYYKMIRNGAEDTFNSLTIQTGNTNGYDFYNETEVSGTQGVAGWLRTNNAASKIAFVSEL